LGTSPTPTVRGESARPPVQLRADEKPSLPYLLEAVQDEKRDLDELAGEAIGRFGARAKGVVPASSKLIDQRRGNLEVIVKALGQIGPDAKAAGPALRGLHDDCKYESLRSVVQDALSRIEQEKK
jgi:hypothetical protein